MYGSINHLEFQDDTVESTHAVISFVEKGGFAIKVLKRKMELLTDDFYISYVFLFYQQHYLRTWNPILGPF